MRYTLFRLLAPVVLAIGFPLAATAQFPVTIGHAHPNFGFTQALWQQYADFLEANDYHTVTADQFIDWRVNAEPMPIRPILLTFDDNYIRIYTEVYPVLKSKGFTAVNFAHTNYVGVPGANDHADWSEIQEMETDGTILTESHTLNHVNLTAQSPLVLHDEVTSSKLAIEANLIGKTCNHIAYPYGAYNGDVIAACQAAGYVAGYSTIQELNTRDTPLFELRRVSTDGATLEAFKSRIGFYNLPPPPPGEGWTIDNDDVNFFGDDAVWPATTSVGGYYGADYREKAPGDGSQPAQWAAYLPQGGAFNVYVRWTSAAGRASNASYTVHHSGGTNIVTVDQRSGGGDWYLLGNFGFNTTEPARVVLADAGDGTLVADGVWFEPEELGVTDWIVY
jgi:peptidoglycan/xylan/chitin deacetylase (PgdA/CDA1 family)